MAKAFSEKSKSGFREDGRLALPNSLHRISRAQYYGETVLLTCRIGRERPHAARMLVDLLAEVKYKRKSLLLLGPPGVGKTVLLRSVAYLLSVELEMGCGVMVVDTSNEIAGEGAQPHHCIGSARRRPVQSRDRQYDDLLKAVQNDNPDVVIVDEISNSQEASSAQTISRRGVRLVATAHGSELSDLMKNPALSCLVGGIQSVTLGDEAVRDLEKRRQCKVKKTQLERAGAPVFDILVELKDQDHMIVHRDVAKVVSSKLSGDPYSFEERKRRFRARPPFEEVFVSKHTCCSETHGVHFDHE